MPPISTLDGSQTNQDNRHIEASAFDNSPECADFFDTVFDYSNKETSLEAVKKSYDSLPVQFRQAAMDYLGDSAAPEIQAEIAALVGTSEPAKVSIVPATEPTTIAQQNTDLAFPASKTELPHNVVDKQSLHDAALALADEIKRIRVNADSILSVRRYAQKLPHLLVASLADLSSVGGAAEAKNLLLDADLVSRLKDLGGESIQSKINELSSGSAVETNSQVGITQAEARPSDNTGAPGITFDTPVSESIATEMKTGMVPHNGASAEPFSDGIASAGDNGIAIPSQGQPAGSTPSLSADKVGDKFVSDGSATTVADGIKVGVKAEKGDEGGQTVLIDANGKTTAIDEGAVVRGDEPNLTLGAIAASQPVFGQVADLNQAVVSSEQKAVSDIAPVQKLGAPDVVGTPQNSSGLSEPGTLNNEIKAETQVTVGNTGAEIGIAAAPLGSVGSETTVQAGDQIAVGVDTNVVDAVGSAVASGSEVVSVSPVNAEAGVGTGNGPVASQDQVSQHEGPLPVAGGQGAESNVAGSTVPVGEEENIDKEDQPHGLLSRLFGGNRKRVHNTEVAASAQRDAMKFWENNRNVASENEQEQAA